jgi:hypothetical protein
MRRYSLLVASLILLVGLLIAGWKENRTPAPVELVPTLSGQAEYCLTCHAGLAEISPAHPLKAFGCVLCHGGERLALDADLAHSSMRGGNNPSDFAVVEASCGGENCHSGAVQGFRDHIQRATTSIQETYAGAIASIRYTFGLQPDLTARMGSSAVQAPNSTSGITSLEAFDPVAGANPFVLAFGRDCLTCHLSAQPPEGSETFRFTGCSACHTPTQTRDFSGTPQVEPGKIHTLTTAISYTQCDTCHNRGNYDLRSMQFNARPDMPTDRLHDYYQPIAETTLCEWTLDCVDCHTRTEAMGDGSLYSAKKDIQYTRCQTCHGTLTSLPLTRTLTEADVLAFRLGRLNPVVTLEPGDVILVTEKDEPLWNTRLLPDGTYTLVGKSTRQTFPFKPVMGSACTQNGTDQSAAYCHTCHAVER